MKLSFLSKLIGSGLYTGYVPFASGTFGSLAGLLIYMIPGFENPYIILPSILILAYAGIKAGDQFEKVYGKDPSECTVDEIVGMWISLLLLPKEFWIIVSAFLLWRFMDIVKPFPARKSENLSGGLGIMMDDIISGTYTLIVMHFILFLSANFFN